MTDLYLLFCQSYPLASPIMSGISTFQKIFGLGLGGQLHRSVKQQLFIIRNFGFDASFSHAFAAVLIGLHGV